MTKIVLLGDSVSLRIRPVRSAHAEKTYAEHLMALNQGFFVVNLGRGATSIKSQMADMDPIIRQFPDFYVLNFGIVDCSTRSVPEWVFRFINTIKPTEWLIRRWTRKAVDFFEKKNRKFLVLLRGKRSWTSEKDFKSVYLKTIKLLQKETGAQIICLGINQTDERVESQLPGTKQKINQYNQLIKQVCESTGCSFVDTYNLIEPKNVPDGIHFDAVGHKQVAFLIRDIINSKGSC
jgi:hypothetical protein